MPSTRDTLLGEAARCREAALKTTNQELQVGLLELAQKYVELADKALPGGTVPPLEREHAAQQQQQPQLKDDQKD
jgi:hypothetical protein